MTRVYFDTETHAFEPGARAPRLVILQFAVDEYLPGIVARDGTTIFDEGGGAFDGTDDPMLPDRLVEYWLDNGHTLVGQNVAFDLAVLAANYPYLLPKIFQALREGRVKDTMLRAKLADIARGRYRLLQYDLGSLAHRYGLEVDKDDPWRRRYGLLDGVPLADWPSVRLTVPADDKDVAAGLAPEVGAPLVLDGRDAIRYALHDVTATRTVFLGQEQNYDDALLVDEDAQVRKFFALRLAECWGLRTSAVGVAELERGARERLTELEALLKEPWVYEAPNGELVECPPLMRPDVVPCSRCKGSGQKKGGDPCGGCAGTGERSNPKAGSRDTKSAAARLLAVAGDGPVRLTKTGIKVLGNGKIREVPAAAVRERFEEWGQYVALDSDACQESADPLLEAYAEASSLVKVLSNDVAAWAQGVHTPVHTHFDLAATTRTTSAGPNVQNPRRLPGVRECIVPRGWIDEEVAA